MGSTWTETFGDAKFDIPQEAVDVFRLHIDDEAKHNRLIRSQELRDDDLERALRLAVVDWNGTTPFTNYSFVDHPNIKFLFDGALIICLRQGGLRQTRNQLTYSDGGITVAINDKTALYQSWISQLFQEYEVKKRALKSQLNAESMYSHVPSEYHRINFRR